MMVQASIAAEGFPSFSLSFEDTLILYKRYMPFIQNGALFICTPESFALGDEVFLSVTLPDGVVEHSCSGRVVWITPPAAERGLAAGIGVQLMGSESLSLRDKIEKQLMGMSTLTQQNDTM